MNTDKKETTVEQEEEKLKPTKGTITRTAVLVVSIVNLVLNATGHSTLPFTSAEVSGAIADIFMIVASLVAWWKNQSFTEEAVLSDMWLRKMKAKKAERKGRS